MNCTRCGAALPDNATFCTNCANPNPSMPQAPPPPGYGSPPPGYGPPPPGCGPVPNIPDYLVWSIITTVCCQPFGIAAIVFSVMTMNDKTNGRIDSAMKNSGMARTMIMIGLIGWAVVAFCYAAFIILMVAFGAMAEMQ